MARYIFIRLTETQLMSADVDGAQWVMIDKNEPQQMLEKGTLYEPPTLGMGDKVIVSIPASKLMLTTVSLPNSNINRLRKIVPFTLEEYILDDIDDVHFSIGHIEKNESTPVAVIQKKLLSDNLKAIEKLGLSPTVMVADCLCIPFDEKTWTIFIEDDTALIRTEKDTGFSCTTDILVLMLSQYLKEDNVIQPVNLKSYNVPQELQSEIMNIPFESEVEFSTFDVSGNTEMLFLEQYLENTPSLNLLQGSYSRRQKMGQHFRPWIPLVGLVAAYLVLALIIDIVNYNKLSSNLTALKQEQVKIFKRAFPDAKKIVNPRIQMESRLKDLRKRSGKNASSATTMLAYTAKILRKYKIVGIKTVRYRDSQMDIDVQLTNLQVLDTLKEKLTNNGLWNVEVLSATSRENFVESRIRIKG
jgi:general secretion pathway protein L